jgi:hypothetical protein
MSIPAVNQPKPPLGYRIGNSERVIGGPTGASDGFAVLNLSTGHIFTALGGVWTSNSTSYNFQDLLATWFGTDSANMTGNMMSTGGPGFRIGTSDRIVGGPTAAPTGFYVYNTETGNAFQATGGVWVGGVTFPAALMAAWLAT